MKKKITVIGIMSGTSLDGVDVAAVKFNIDQLNQFEILGTKTYAYNQSWKKKLSEAHHLSAYDFLKLHKEYGHYLGEIVLTFLEEFKISPDYISSHGHTIFHEPSSKFNFQLGDGAFIASTTQITTITDFRTLDIAFGGQGAPLVPIGDEWLFSDYDYCLNIGGIANISYKYNHQRIAFDICPANIVLNKLAQQVGFDFDNHGMIASKGKINHDLLNILNNLDFYSLSFPKSLGREWVEQIIFPILSQQKLSIDDQLATFSEHIAIQIASYTQSNGTLLITGGGAYNDYLISRIKYHSSSKVIIPTSEIIEFKEAIIFALLGLLRVLEKENTLASVTGATTNLCSGIVYLYH
ncbi:MAG: anhydro-N-acetylmuramic acid kinase [Bacteroidales bacterium]|nr:anhydro-N-acetylmuramic acid kinase [Bacteroidales bacterium]